MTVFKKHFAAITSGAIEKTNIIDLRKAINANHRQRNGWSVSVTAPKVTDDEIDELAKAIADHQPTVMGELHKTGVAVLQSKRYRNRFSKEESEVIADIARFELVRFERYDSNVYPVYRVIGKNMKNFLFMNRPWQSGGNGPEILSTVSGPSNVKGI